IIVNIAPDSQLSTDQTSVSFAADATALNSQTITVTAIDDNQDESSQHTGTIVHSIEVGNGDEADYAQGLSIDKITANIADNDSSESGSIDIPADYYQLSVAGTHAHIRSIPSGIDCEYGLGSCVKMFDRGTTVKLELVAIQTAQGLTENDYQVVWDGSFGCEKQQVILNKNRSCIAQVYGKQDVANTGNTDNFEFLNFSGHGLLRGDAEDVILGFILEGTGTTDVILHAEAIDDGVLPQFKLSETLYDAEIGLYGTLIEQQQNTESFTFDTTLTAGAYTIQMSSNGIKDRGMAGITLKDNQLNLANLSVRGYLENLLVLNFIVSGEGTQKLEVNTRVLEGQVSSQLYLLNLADLQTETVAIAEGDIIEVSTGAYAIILTITQGEGIGMIEANLLR
ncbi:hypothetical protein, partial [Candidatus Albibeggiatoa sp. nov. BB20]|uniref:hypothetical protein n=1 Tax=Candidatus Albibeggiatoa sp. nov. BB20 TaxID=3162723 RepID=UPI00336593F4